MLVAVAAALLWGAAGPRFLGLGPAEAITETEPNDTYLTPNPVTIGDTIQATCNPAGDVDWFALNLAAGTITDFHLSTSAPWATFDPRVRLFGPDDSIQLADGAASTERDARVTLRILADGQYFVQVSGGGGTGCRYELSLGTVQLGETEPNDDAASASAAVLGASIWGESGSITDLDFYHLELPAGIIVEIDFDRYAIGSSLVGAVELRQPDGVTPLQRSNPDFGPAGVRWWIAEAGRYVVVVSPAFLGPSPFYRLRLTARAPEPGDPTRILATGLSTPLGHAAGADGTIYVRRDTPPYLVQVDAAGNATPLADGLVGVWPHGIAVDGYGTVLVAGSDAGLPVIWAVTPEGSVSVFSNGVPKHVSAITVDSVGDVWVATVLSYSQPPSLIHLDPLGVIRAARVLPIWFPAIEHLAFSPAGALHVLGNERVYRIVGEQINEVVPGSVKVSGFAFDAGGNLYVSSAAHDRIELFDPQYRVVDTIWASTFLGAPRQLTFARAAGGSMTSRLLVMNGGVRVPEPWATGLLECNPAGPVAPGFRVGGDLLHVANTALAPAVLGAEYADTLRLVEAVSAVRWTVIVGALPANLALDSLTGEIRGIVTAAGQETIGVRATSGTRRGFRFLTVGVGAPTVDRDDAVEALLSDSSRLPSDHARYLDLVGNRNGRYDLGDLRALLMRDNMPPAALPTGAMDGGKR